ncbi:hypothetical protein AX16_009577 [Volvariella volvacea WC 439]|nr:hypothetical protein AX16_009577 [Volvariella volvacea WC 439]
MTTEQDELLAVLPIHFSNKLEPNIQLYQFPLLSRPLQAPPAAAASGKHISARVKPEVRRIEIHVPADPRPEVWSVDRAKQLGAAQLEDDREKNQVPKNTIQDDPRLNEVRLKSEQVPQQGSYMLGVMRDGQLHLHPITETHQFRPAMTYLDVLSRKARHTRGAGADSDSDDVPVDPDEPAPAPAAKKEKKTATGEAKEVQVQVSATKKGDEKSQMALGGVSAVRRDMLRQIRVEEEESWQDLKFFDVTTAESETAFEDVFSQRIQLSSMDPTYDSETESEGGSCTIVPDTQQTPHDNAHIFTSVAIGTAPAFEIVYDAVHKLCDAGSLKGANSDEMLVLVTPILGFLSDPLGHWQCQQISRILIELVQLRVLKALLEYRAYLRDNEPHIAAERVFLCWVDVMLTKIGELTIIAANDFLPIEDQNIGPGIRSRKENDAIRAASQLPDDWDLMIRLLQSGNLSPASRRLALYLLFAVQVVGPQLGSKYHLR